jgi:DNA-binding FadR family transcriptional regulator
VRRRAAADDARPAAILDNATMPLYAQLADLFRQRIQKGVWKEGEKLPSLEQLVQEFGVARVTVRQAIDRLTRERLVSTNTNAAAIMIGEKGAALVMEDAQGRAARGAARTAAA